MTSIRDDSLGLVSKVFPSEKVVEEAIKTAKTISQHSAPIVTLCKEAVNKGTKQCAGIGALTFFSQRSS